ncbi:hypothetical protein WMY93_005753 [Mugilogobius chulae]|uniref:Uncharacterized protein n=1 Tax=Mugilogobius chulae TaxID=88201 RepID=A0AAW0PX84_9GOBI
MCAREKRNCPETRGLPTRSHARSRAQQPLMASGDATLDAHHPVDPCCGCLEQKERQRTAVDFEDEVTLVSLSITSASSSHRGARALSAHCLLFQLLLRARRKERERERKGEREEERALEISKKRRAARSISSRARQEQQEDEEEAVEEAEAAPRGPVYKLSLRNAAGDLLELTFPSFRSVTRGDAPAAGFTEYNASASAKTDRWIYRAGFGCIRLHGPCDLGTEWSNRLQCHSTWPPGDMCHGNGKQSEDGGRARTVGSVRGGHHVGPPSTGPAPQQPPAHSSPPPRSQPEPGHRRCHCC